jgi:hypothetical protein
MYRGDTPPYINNRDFDLVKNYRELTLPSLEREKLYVPKNLYITGINTIDVFMHILSYMDVSDFLSLSLVCKELALLVKSNAFAPEKKIIWLVKNGKADKACEFIRYLNGDLESQLKLKYGTRLRAKEVIVSMEIPLLESVAVALVAISIEENAAVQFIMRYKSSIDYQLQTIESFNYTGMYYYIMRMAIINKSWTIIRFILYDERVMILRDMEYIVMVFKSILIDTKDGKSVHKISNLAISVRYVVILADILMHYEGVVYTTTKLSKEVAIDLLTIAGIYKFTKLISAVSKRIGCNYYPDIKNIINSPWLVRCFFSGVENNSVEITQFFVDNGIDIHHDSDYASKEAARRGYVNIIAILIDKLDAEINHVLLEAINSKEYFVVKKILNSKHPSLDIEFNENEPIKIACSMGSDSIVDLLLSHGVDPSKFDNTPIELAEISQNVSMIRCIYDAKLKHQNKKMRLN